MKKHMQLLLNDRTWFLLVGDSLGMTWFGGTGILRTEATRRAEGATHVFSTHNIVISGI